MNCSASMDVMEIKDIEKLAALSRLKLTEEEKQKFAQEMDDILAYVKQIDEVTGKSDEKKAGDVRNVLREDENPHESGIYTEALLNSAPKRQGKYVEVKKIL